MWAVNDYVYFHWQVSWRWVVCSGIDKNFVDCGLLLVAWRWIYLFVALALVSVAYVLFGMKCYHLHEGYLASLRK